MSNSCDFARPPLSITLCDIEWERVNLVISARAAGHPNIEQLRCVITAADGTVYPIKVQLDADRYVARLNITRLPDGDPIGEGVYSVMYDCDGACVLPVLSPEFKAKINCIDKNFIYADERRMLSVSPRADSDFRTVSLYAHYSRLRGAHKRMPLKKLFTRCLLKPVMGALYKLCSLFCKKDGKHILFACDYSAALTGNLKCFYERLVERGFDKQYSIDFLFADKYSGKMSLKQLLSAPMTYARADYIFVDNFSTLLGCFRFDKATEIVQLWHGLGAMKIVGYSRFGEWGGPYSLGHDYPHRQYTKTIASSAAVRRYYAESFALDEDSILVTASPRVDRLLDKDREQEFIRSFYEQHPELEGRRLILYAPTYRGEFLSSAEFDYSAIDMDEIYRFCGEQYAFVFKMHPSLPPTFIDDQYSDRIIDLTGVYDINDLLYVSYCIVSDYSSVVFEASLLDKPVVFFTPDLDDYTSSRGFYCDFEGYVPGKLCRTISETLEVIAGEQFDYEALRTFRDFNFDYADAHNSDRIIDWVFPE